MQILIIDNTIEPDCWGSRELVHLTRSVQEASSAATLYVRRAPQQDLPLSPKGFDRIIVSGSKTSILEDALWIDQLISFVKKTVDAKIPYLGVCYGHQILIRALGGKTILRKSERPEFGWTEIKTSGPSPLLRGLPERFYSFSSHFEEAGTLPSPMKNLASSERCQIQACQLENQPIYGIQFHPEKSIESGKKTLRERKKKGTPPELLNPDQSEKLYNPKIGETIFRNFLLSK